MHLTKRRYLMLGSVLLAAVVGLAATRASNRSDPMTVPELTAIHVTQLALQSVAVNGQTYDIRTSSSARVGGNHKKRNWVWIGGGAGGGALIGAVAGGGEGALIGGPVGAAAGTTVALVTGKKDIKLRPETPLTFRLAKPVTINVTS